MINENSSREQSSSKFTKQVSSKKSNEPQLICTQRELSSNIEDEIKSGFFELKQKFLVEGQSSIYISHVVLHEKHPIFKKCEIETLKKILVDSSIVYLKKEQILYRYGTK